MIKEWEYEGIVYKVSDDGKIYGPKVGELKQRIDCDGYMKVTVGGMYRKRTAKRVHTIIARVFLEDYQEGLEVNHKNFDRTDNRVENLEMMTHLDNIQYSVQAGHYKTLIGERNGRAKLTWEQVEEIRNRYKNGCSILFLSKEYLVSTSTIDCIVKNKTWIKKI